MAHKKQKPIIEKEEILRLLRLKNETFASLLDDELLDLLTCDSEEIDYKPGEPIIRQHDPSDALYILLKGRCAIIVNDKPISHLEAGDMTGEMGLLQNTLRTATVTPVEPCRALCIPKESFQKMTRSPKLTSWLINMLTERLKRSSHNTARALKEMEEIMQDHMELGRVQRSLLPKEMPQDPRFRIHVLYEPCAYVGGDYYDALMLDQDHLILIVADVTGHGAQASISMAIVRSFIHQGHLGKSPETILRHLNRHLFEYGPTQHFVTSQVAILDLKKNVLKYAYAGHPPILHLRNGQCDPLKGNRAFFLRFKLDADYKNSSITLKPGDRVVFYTDGPIEMFNLEGKMFNVEGLQKFMEDTQKESIANIPGELESTLHKFREGSPVEDDMTFMALEITKA